MIIINNNLVVIKFFSLILIITMIFLPLKAQLWSFYIFSKNKSRQKAENNTILTLIWIMILRISYFMTIKIIINWIFPFIYTALILEEIGIDSNDKDEEKKFLDEALKLHLSSLEQTRSAFGEENVQTAKHYGNLGRLCQSMKKHEVSRIAPYLVFLLSKFIRLVNFKINWNLG